MTKRIYLEQRKYFSIPRVCKCGAPLCTRSHIVIVDPSAFAGQFYLCLPCARRIGKAAEGGK